MVETAILIRMQWNQIAVEEKHILVNIFRSYSLYYIKDHIGTCDIDIFIRFKFLNIKICYHY